MIENIGYILAILVSYLDTFGGPWKRNGVRGTACCWYHPVNLSSRKLNTDDSINENKKKSVVLLNDPTDS
jgi:hypothetical protein